MQKLAIQGAPSTRLFVDDPAVGIYAAIDLSAEPDLPTIDTSSPYPASRAELIAPATLRPQNLPQGVQRRAGIRMWV
jgi:hypothetical protein